MLVQFDGYYKGSRVQLVTLWVRVLGIWQVLCGGNG